MTLVTRSGCKLKDVGNNSKGENIGIKGSTASGSTNSDTSILRRSTRETPSNKQRDSSPLNTRKSERIEKRTPPTPPIKRKSERVEKQKMPSPLRRSERGENSRSSCSSESKKSENGLELLDTKNKKDLRDNNGRRRTTDNPRDRKRNGQTDRRPAHLLLGKKRLDARSYRESLRQEQPTKNQEADLNKKKLEEHDDTSQGDTDHTEAGTSKEVKDGADCVRNMEEVEEKDAGEGSKVAVEGPSSGLRKLDLGMSNVLGEVEPSLVGRKRRRHSDELCESNNEQGSPVSKCEDNSLESSKEVCAEAETAQLDCSARENCPNVSITSEGRSRSGDQCLKRASDVGNSKRKRKRKPEGSNSDSDASVPAANEEIYTSGNAVTSANALNSPPSERTRSTYLELCDACTKRKRLEVDSQKCNMCSCSSGGNHNSCSDPSPEEVHQHAAFFSNPENEEMPITCVLNNENKTDADQIEKKSGDDVHLLKNELLPEVERNYVPDQTHLDNTAEISTPLATDGSEHGSRDGLGLNEESCKMLRLEESSVNTQTECDHNACVVCKLGGKLLCCDGKGCKRNYHLDCLDPPFKVVPLGVWHCSQCIKKKIQFGVHSVSKGVESLWDIREEEVSDCEGIQKQKKYLVKYKGLAHVHNKWILEHQLLLEAPVLVAKFKKHQVLKSEWTTPHRLLQKREYEWFVKWSGLGYEHATWELEDAPFLRSPEAGTLITDYESRHQKAISASNPSREKLLEQRKFTSFKLSKLPGGSVSGPDNDHLNFVNKLREYWHKNQNAVVVDDQAEFKQSAPSVNVVIYTGNKEVRESVRALEFYEDGGCVMLQVLLSPIDAIIEDQESLELIGWEAIIVDECHRSRMSRYFEQIRMLTNGFRLLFLNGPVKENIVEYQNLLSFLESGSDRNGDANLKIDSVKNDSGHSISKLKERFSHFVACERKSVSSKFVEYWVPVQLSNVQLEQYCASLLANSISLRSCSKSDPVGALRDILISVRKCCDHPYLVDESLQSLLMKDLPEVKYLDVGVNASGKLQVLDKILPEIKKRGLRVLILFQSIGGSGRNSIGDILDDFLRQRFGPDSYERIDSVLVNSRKQAALNMFNSKDRGRFVFLIENRACLPSIKLSSVDMVILFDSDWNPLNDLRALQRITIDTQFDQLKVFRFYSSCTVEEKVLSFAKQEMILDSNVQNINRTTSHTLLLWGAQFLFHKLDEFHGGCTQSSASNVSCEQLFVNDIVQDMLRQLPNCAEDNGPKNCKYVRKAEQSGAFYSGDILLLGEREMQSRVDELPHVLWANVLDGRHPQWRYTSGSSQRNRKKVQKFDDLPLKPQVENDEIVKKRKKVDTNTLDPNTPESCLDEKRNIVRMEREGTPRTQVGNGSQNLLTSIADTNSMNQSVSDQPMVESEGTRNIHDSKKDLHLSLKPLISKLCEILQLPEDVKSMAGKFLEYIVYKHRISREPVTIFQAFQISLCWSAASLMKYKMSRKDSLSFLKQHFNFQCKEEETQSVYSKLRTLKKLFSQTKSVESISADNSSPRDKEKHFMSVGAKQSTFSAHHELEDGEIGESRQCFVQQNSAKKKQDAEAVNAKISLKNNLSMNFKVKKIHRRRMRKLYQKQMEEFEKFNKSREKIMEKEIAELDRQHKLESILIRNIHNQISIRLEKLKAVDEEFARKKEELNIHLEKQQKKLEDMQRTAREEETRMNDHWLEEAKSGRSVDAYDKEHLSESGFRMESMEELEHVVVSHEVSGSGLRAEHLNDCEHDEVGCENATTSSRTSSENSDTNGAVSVLPSEGVTVETSAVVPDKLLGAEASELPPLTIQSCEKGVAMDTLVPEDTADTRPDQQSRLAGCDCDSTFSEQTAVAPLGQDHAAPSQDDQVPLLQRTYVQWHTDMFFVGGSCPHKWLSRLSSLRVGCVPVSEQAQPSIPEVRLIETQGCEVQNSLQAHIQSSLPTCAVLSGLVDDNTPVLPPAVQLNRSPLVAQPSNEECQPDISVPTVVNPEETSESSQQFESEIQVPPEEQDVIINHSCPVSDNQLMHDGSQQTQVRVPATDPASTEQSPSPPAEQSPADVPASIERHNCLQQYEAQIHPPVGDRDPMHDTQSRVTSAQPTEVASHPALRVQPDLFNDSVSQSSGQSQLHLPTVSAATGSGSHLSDYRSMGILPEFRPHPPHIAPVASRTPQQFCHDPLQNELGRIRREEEQANKMHEDEKQRLTFEREKEIEVIRQKYSVMLQDAEVEFKERKNALETNYNIVHMNRILAEAFRFKCDNRMAVAPGLPQGAPPGSMQQAFHSSSPQIAERPVPIMPGAPTSPPVQMVHQSSALFSSNPVRSHFGQVLSPSGNQQTGSEMRSPAPHLQPFRPTTFVAAPSLSPVSSVLPGQQTLGVPTSASSVRPQHTPHVPPSMGPFSRTHQSENMTALRGSHSSLSALELLMDTDRHPSPNQPTLLPPLRDIGQTSDTWGMAEPTLIGTLRGPAVHSANAAGIVCLSDDD
ncbi:hypothetical protein IFM89_025590 [Coptis chinensis]|uniref:Helicase protein MOM1 n=1 Tax=Coptis chinensis TaxID=261450 RepID=A0A835LKF0_9MAGN|nr:hypothetical protein IFM89_025590 [Coptis chinensis]